MSFPTSAPWCPAPWTRPPGTAGANHPGGDGRGPGRYGRGLPGGPGRRDRPMLEPMDLFFDRRLKEYDAHQLHEIESAQEFYPFTAAQLPRTPERRCWTWAAARAWSWSSISPKSHGPGDGNRPGGGMLQALREKFRSGPAADPSSYLELPPGGGNLRCGGVGGIAAPLHQSEKVPLYRRVLAALKPGGYFLLTTTSQPRTRKKNTSGGAAAPAGGGKTSPTGPSATLIRP